MTRRRNAKEAHARLRAAYLAATSDLDLAMQAGITLRAARAFREREGLPGLRPRGRPQDAEEHEARRAQLALHPEWTSVQHALARGISPSRWRTWKSTHKETHA